jgi:translation initiation factor IF-2
MSTTTTKPATIKRPPVIVVLGHVDHGKTSLLSKIRDTRMPHEPGKITQSIGAYEIEHNGKQITFIDTPGHEAFSKMRARGAQAADLAILVIAADDGVQPQTKEVVQTLKEIKLPFVVAINKIDKSGIDSTRAKNELTAEGVLLEGYGGDISFQEVSAKTGEGINELLDLVLLASEFTELDTNPEKPGTGFILEAKLDSRKGIIVSGIVKNGTLKIGDPIHAGGAMGKIKNIEDFSGKRVDSAGPGTPVLILGFETLPEIGADFLAEIKTGTSTSTTETTKPMSATELGEDERLLNVILKGDVSGSLESLTQIIEHLPRPENIRLIIITSSLGDVSDGDVKNAISSKALIIGFKTKVSKAAEALARVHNIRIITSEIVYELITALEEEFKKLEQSVIKGELEILGIFGKKDGKEQIVGGKVKKGEILNNSTIEIIRRGNTIGNGKIVNVQSNKKDIPALTVGNEGGILIISETEIKKGDYLILR